MKIFFTFILFSFSLLLAKSEVPNYDKSYIINEGTYIYVNMITKPTGKLKARLQGMVLDNIYGAYGRNILIQKGSSVLCVEVQSKIPTKCKTRIITPLGRNIIFEGYWERIGTSYYVLPENDLIFNNN